MTQFWKLIGIYFVISLITKLVKSTITNFGLYKAKVIVSEMEPSKDKYISQFNVTIVEFKEGNCSRRQIFDTNEMKYYEYHDRPLTLGPIIRCNTYCYQARCISSKNLSFDSQYNCTTATFNKSQSLGSLRSLELENITQMLRLTVNFPKKYERCTPLLYFYAEITTPEMPDLHLTTFHLDSNSVSHTLPTISFCTDICVSLLVCNKPNQWYFCDTDFKQLCEYSGTSPVNYVETVPTAFFCSPSSNFTFVWRAWRVRCTDKFNIYKYLDTSVDRASILLNKTRLFVQGLFLDFSQSLCIVITLEGSHTTATTTYYDFTANKICCMQNGIDITDLRNTNDGKIDVHIIIIDQNLIKTADVELVRWYGNEKQALQIPPYNPKIKDKVIDYSILTFVPGNLCSLACFISSFKLHDNTEKTDKLSRCMLVLSDKRTNFTLFVDRVSLANDDLRVRWYPCNAGNTFYWQIYELECQNCPQKRYFTRNTSVYPDGVSFRKNYCFTLFIRQNSERFKMASKCYTAMEHSKSTISMSYHSRFIRAWLLLVLSVCLINQLDHVLWRIVSIWTR